MAQSQEGSEAIQKRLDQMASMRIDVQAKIDAQALEDHQKLDKMRSQMNAQFNQQSLIEKNALRDANKAEAEAQSEAQKPRQPVPVPQTGKLAQDPFAAENRAQHGVGAGGFNVQSELDVGAQGGPQPNAGQGGATTSSIIEGGTDIPGMQMQETVREGESTQRLDYGGVVQNFVANLIGLPMTETRTSSDTSRQLVQIPGWVEGKVEDMMALYGSALDEPEKVMRQLEGFHKAMGGGPESKKVLEQFQVEVTLYENVQNKTRQEQVATFMETYRRDRKRMPDGTTEALDELQEIDAEGLDIALRYRNAGVYTKYHAWLELHTSNADLKGQYELDAVNAEKYVHERNKTLTERDDAAADKAMEIGHAWTQDEIRQSFKKLVSPAAYNRGQRHHVSNEVGRDINNFGMALSQDDKNTNRDANAVLAQDFMQSQLKVNEDGTSIVTGMNQYSWHRFGENMMIQKGVVPLISRPYGVPPENRFWRDPIPGGTYDTQVSYIDSTQMLKWSPLADEEWLANEANAPEARELANEAIKAGALYRMPDGSFSWVHDVEPGADNAVHTRKILDFMALHTTGDRQKAVKRTIRGIAEYVKANPEDTDANNYEKGAQAAKTFAVVTGGDLEAGHERMKERAAVVRAEQTQFLEDVGLDAALQWVRGFVGAKKAPVTKDEVIKQQRQAGKNFAEKVNATDRQKADLAGLAADESDPVTDTIYGPAKPVTGGPRPGSPQQRARDSMDAKEQLKIPLPGGFRRQRSSKR